MKQQVHSRSFLVYGTTEVYRGNVALRESEARLAFLDRLGAETAPLADADAVLATATRLLGEHQNLSVCAYASIDKEKGGSPSSAIGRRPARPA